MSRAYYRNIDYDIMSDEFMLDAAINKISVSDMIRPQKRSRVILQSPFVFKMIVPKEIHSILTG
ncbi:MAG: hypothetical protein IPK61_07265 [Saprospiraceae bacterium]|nr:hypothetical protein [Saprospiraceae bacterium]